MWQIPKGSFINHVIRGRSAKFLKLSPHGNAGGLANIFSFYKGFAVQPFRKSTLARSAKKYCDHDMIRGERNFRETIT